MVQIINDPNSGNIFGQIGRNFGQGLAEQLPKGIERGQLSQGLKELENKPGLSPYQQAAHLYGLPGGSEAAQTLLPLLQEQRARDAYLRESTNPQPSQQQKPSLSITGDEGDIPLSQQVRGANFLEPMTNEQIKSEVGNLVRSGRFLDPLKAESYVREQDKNRIVGDEAFQNKQILAESEFEKLRNQSLQSHGVNDFYDINGDLQRKLANKVKTEVANGGNPTQVANKYAKEALEFAKSRRSLRDVGKKNFWNTTPSESLRSFDNIKKHYDKMGQTDEFAKDLITYADLDPEAAYSFAFPVSKDKKLNEFIDSKKPTTKLGSSLKLGSKNEKQIADHLSKNLSSDVSFLSIADRLDDLGLNKDAFWKEIQRNYADGTIPEDKLNPRQVQELGQTLSKRPSMGTIYYKSLFFKNPWRQNAK